MNTAVRTSPRQKRYIITSILLHVVLLAFLAHRNETLSAKSEDAVEIELVQVAPKSETIIQQVVETSKVEKAKEAAAKAFAGEQTQKVDRQTIAKQAQHYNDGTRASGADGKKAAEKFKSVKLGDLGVAMNMKPLGHLGPPGTVATTNDYMKDVQEGAQTLLNTKEFLFFSYYQRIRRQLEQFYGPTVNSALTKMVRRGRYLASDKEHETKILMVLNSTGSIKQIVIEDTSGIQDLDQAAVDSFNKAGPFPNPPKGMIETDGSVRVPWILVLKT